MPPYKAFYCMVFVITEVLFETKFQLQTNDIAIILIMVLQLSKAFLSNCHDVIKRSFQFVNSNQQKPQNKTELRELMISSCSSSAVNFGIYDYIHIYDRLYKVIK